MVEPSQIAWPSLYETTARKRMPHCTNLETLDPATFAVPTLPQIFVLAWPTQTNQLPCLGATQAPAVDTANLVSGRNRKCALEEYYKM